MKPEPEVRLLGDYNNREKAKETFKNTKRFKQVLEMAVMRDVTSPTRFPKDKGEMNKLEFIAERLVHSAMQGDMDAIKLIVERLDGKVPTALTIGPSSEIGVEPIPASLEWVRNIIGEAKNREAKESVPN